MHLIWQCRPERMGNKNSPRSVSTMVKQTELHHELKLELITYVSSAVIMTCATSRARRCKSYTVVNANGLIATSWTHAIRRTFKLTR